MSKALRETVADWLMAVAALVMLLSLFLAWSHQFSPAFLARYRSSPALHGVPHDPDAWQVYSLADVLLALIAGGLLAVALWGGRARRLALAIALCVALGFTIHALSVPPTSGAVIFDPSATPPGYADTGATSGAGETVALVALVMGAAGVALSYSVEL
ncbi:MAG TPA: hypothetical protein VG365_13840 [Solirubrobacteraceae bacterium]|nr:hypothetical protein [Solirubrobacteraceae bacterium]